MAHTTTVTVNLGTGARRLTGAAYWDTTRQTYAALLRLFPDDHSYPPSWARFGLRTAEFVTPDALVNHLGAIGLEADDATLVALEWLRHEVTQREGSPELVGLVDPEQGRRLYLVTPSQLVLPLMARVGHHDYRLHWGDASPAAIETARLICEQAFVRRPSADVETFALTLTYEYLSEVEGDFSLDLNALCDWFLTDSELSTGLDPSQLRPLTALPGPAAA